MPWKVKKLRKVGPFWLPARASVEHVDPRSAVVRRVTHRPLFGHGHHHDAEIDVRAVGEPNETPIDR